MSTEVEILKSAKLIAVVGASSTPKRPAFVAPKFLIDHGFNIIPVNPMEQEVHGIKAVPSLSDVHGKIDIVSIFRASANVPPIVDEAIKVGTKVIWMQEGVEHEEAAAKARAAGIEVIMNRCIHCAVLANEATFPPMRTEVEILKSAKLIAVVGASSTPKRPAFVAPKFLIDHGFNIIPVNPMEQEVHGIKAVPSLSDVHGKIDIVSIFRASANVPPIVDEAIKVGTKVIWMQEGVEHEEAAAKARAAGIEVIMNRCIHCAVLANEATFPAIKQG